MVRSAGFILFAATPKGIIEDNPALSAFDRWSDLRQTKSARNRESELAYRSF
jgi:hypothetical protein